MAIKEEIFEEFFNKLRVDQEFPKSIVEDLQKHWEEGKTFTQDTVLEFIKKGSISEHKG
jgi:hypothetical protein